MFLPFTCYFNKIKQLAILCPFLPSPHSCQTDSVLLPAWPTDLQLCCKGACATLVPLPPCFLQPVPPERPGCTCSNAYDSVLVLQPFSGVSLASQLVATVWTWLAFTPGLQSRSHLLTLFSSSGLQGPQTQIF